MRSRAVNLSIEGASHARHLPSVSMVQSKTPFQNADGSELTHERFSVWNWESQIKSSMFRMLSRDLQILGLTISNTGFEGSSR